MTPTAIEQTQDGYLWVGTYNGLARFDGVRFASFTINNTPELASDHIMALHEDEQGVLWIGTGEGGLIRYKQGQFSAFFGEGFSNATVYAICEDAHGTLWVGTSKGLLPIRLDERKDRIAGELLLPRQSVTGAVCGRGDEQWVSTSRAIHRVTDGKLVESWRAPAEIHALAVDALGEPWVSYASGGIGRRAEERTLDMSRSKRKVNAMHLAADGTLWAATLGGELGRLDAGATNFLLLEAKLPEKFVAIHADEEGNIWAGADSSGLWRLRKSVVTHLNESAGLLTSFVTAMRRDARGRVWVGTWGKGLHVWNGSRFTPVRMPLAPNITTVLEDREQKLWFGSYGGSMGWIEEVGGTNAVHFETGLAQHCRVLFEDAEGGLWIGTRDAGVEHVRGGETRRYGVREGLSDEHVRAIAQDADGDIWVGTSRGLNRLRDGRIEKYFRANGLGGEQVRALFRDSEGTLWIGSTGGGLTRWKDGKLQSIGLKEGLINDWIEQIIEDDYGYLWLGSNGGLMRVSLRELNDCVSRKVGFVHCTAFRREEGLPLPNCGTGFQPSCLKMPDGKLWMGTDAGIIILDPGQLRARETTPPVYVEEMLVDQEEQTIRPSGSRLALKPGTQRLEFRYTGLDASAPALVRFRYKLEGFDSDWVNAGTRREAIYTRVPPGDYQFRVLAANNHGHWNEVGASLDFSIQPHFWQTGIFRAMVPILGLILGGCLVWAYVSRNHRRELANLERKHALERERARIAQDMHDGLGSSLVKISLLGEQAESRFAENGQAQPQIRKITATARQVVREMDEIVWAVNPRNDTVENFASYLCGFAREHFSDTAVDCRLDIPAALPALPLRAEVRHNLFLAVREALNNALKHSGAGQVWVQMKFTSSELMIEIRDDGCGFSTGRQARGNGLDNMQQRLQQIAGTMTIEAGRDGTTVHFSVPMDPERPLGSYSYMFM